MDKKHVVHCLNCARKINDSLNNFVILEEYHKTELQEVYDKFVLHVSPVTSTSSISISTTTTTNTSTPSFSNPTANSTTIPTTAPPNGL